MRGRRRRGVGEGLFFAVAAAVISVASSGAAFTPQGHTVLEAMAYRELGQGADDDRSALAYLMNDGEIERPVCSNGPVGSCKDRFESDPLAFWPPPHTDSPDMILARQFSHVGQCFHF